MPEHSSKRILVVDDEEEMLFFVDKVLRRARYDVVSTTKGKEAVQMAKSLSPDLIILDLVIPDMGGGEIASLLSKHPETVDIPIIFLTGTFIDEENYQSKPGGKYTLLKPVTATDLLDVVERSLSADKPL